MGFHILLAIALAASIPSTVSAALLVAWTHRNEALLHRTLRKSGGT